MRTRIHMALTLPMGMRVAVCVVAAFTTAVIDHDGSEMNRIDHNTIVPGTPLRIYTYDIIPSNLCRLYIIYIDHHFFLSSSTRRRFYP